MGKRFRTTKWWRRAVDPVDASGIIRVRTDFLPVQRRGSSRRKLPRPPLAVNLALLGFALLLSTASVLHRRTLDRRFQPLMKESASVPLEIRQVRQDLAGMEIDERTLARELDARLKYVESARRRDFYILLDTKRQRLTFRFGDRIVREAPLEVGAPRTIEGRRGKRWTFAPLSGAFDVAEKTEQGSWLAPEWIYWMSGRPPPRTRPRVVNGLGRYVLVLSNGYAIHSPPSPESPLKGPRPGSFMVPEADLAAIWKRVGPETRVYVF